jgi:integrase/recombinase XerD
MSKAYLELEEVERLEAAAEYLRDKLLIRLLFHLGCRVSEALAITVDDVDLDRRQVTIRHLKTRLKLSCPHCDARLSRAHVFCPGCGRAIEKAAEQAKEHQRFRKLPLNATLFALLQDYIERDGPVTRNGKKFLFGINRHRAWQIVKEGAVRAGLPQLMNTETGKVHSVSPHRLRDAFAVMAVKHDDSGDGLRMLQEHLGHQSITTTMKYRKVSGEEHQEWYQGLWKEIGEGNGKPGNSNHQ